MRDLYKLGGLMVKEADLGDFVPNDPQTLVIKLVSFYSSYKKPATDFFKEVPAWFDKTKIQIVEDHADAIIEISGGRLQVSEEFWSDLVGHALNGEYGALVITGDSAMDDDKLAFAANVLVICGYSAFEALDTVAVDGEFSKHAPIDAVVDLWVAYGKETPEARAKEVAECKKKFIKKAAVYNSTGVQYPVATTGNAFPSAARDKFLDGFESEFLTTIIRPAGNGV